MNSYNISFGMKIQDIPKTNKIIKRFIDLKHLKMNGYTAFINGDIYTPSNKITQQNLLFKNGKLIAVNDFDENKIHKTINVVDIKNKIITPAFVDEHIHGGFGFDFNKADEKQIRLLLKRLKKNGHGDILATFVPDSVENFNKQFKIIDKIMKNPDKNATKISGIHMEGPFLNPQKAGIHPPEILLEPSIENFKKIDFKNVKLVTLAPELDKNFELTNFLNSKGIITSAGHSMATAQQIKNSNVKQVTHLFNAMAPLHHRIPSISNEGLFNPKLKAEVNTSFDLLDPNIFNLIKKIKNIKNIIFISDAIPGANIKKHSFFLNNKKIIIDNNGVAKGETGILAGSMQFMNQLASKLVKNTDFSFSDFIQCSCINPAKNLGIKDNYILKINHSPNFNIWNKNKLTVEKTFIN